MRSESPIAVMAEVDAAAEWEAEWGDEVADPITLAEKISAEEEAASLLARPIGAEMSSLSKLLTSSDQVQDAGVLVERFFIKADEEYSNNERFPLLCYRHVYDAAKDGDASAMLKSNGWVESKDESTSGVAQYRSDVWEVRVHTPHNVADGGDATG